MLKENVWAGSLISGSTSLSAGESKDQFERGRINLMQETCQLKSLMPSLHMKIVASRLGRDETKEIEDESPSSPIHSSYIMHGTLCLSPKP